MAWIILFLITLALFGAIVGASTRSIAMRAIWTVFFALCWLLVVLEADRRHDASAIWTAWGIGLVLFLVGIWIASRMQRGIALDRLADASTEELHETLLSLVDVHGDGDSRWLAEAWLTWKYEEQFDWTRRHRARIKQELAVAASGGQFEPVRFWNLMEALDIHPRTVQADIDEEIVWDAKLLLLDGSRQIVSVFAESSEEARQMVVSHYGLETTIETLERNRSA